MKKTKKIVVETLALAFVASFAAGVVAYSPAGVKTSAQSLNNTTVSLDETTITINNQAADAVTLTVGEDEYNLRFDTQDGAAIRDTDPNGLRFYSYISQKDIEELGDTYGVENVEFGSVVATKAAYEANGGKLEIGEEGVNKVPAKNFVLVDGTQTSAEARDGIFRFNATVSPVEKDNYATDAVSRGYVKVTVDQNEYVAYTDAEDFDATTNTRSVATVAKAVLNGAAPLTNDVRLKMENFAAIDKTDTTITLEKTDYLSLELASALEVNGVTRVYDVTSMSEEEVADETSAPVVHTYLSEMDDNFAGTEEARTRILSVYADGEIYRVKTLFVSKVVKTAADLLSWYNGLNFIDENTYDGYVVLGASIDMSGKTISSPVFARDASKGFKGTFDGNGYTISNATFGAGGLFGTLNPSGTLKNLAITNAYMETYLWDAAKDALAYNAIVADYTAGTIDNCLIDAKSWGNGASGSPLHHAHFLGQNCTAKINDSVFYMIRRQRGENGWVQNHTNFVYNKFNGEFTNSYIFTAPTDYNASTSYAVDYYTTDEKDKFDGSTLYKDIAGVTTYVYNQDLSAVSAAMDEALTGTQWNFTGSKVAFNAKDAMAESGAVIEVTAKAEYAKYNGLDLDFTGDPIANEEALVVNANVADGAVEMIVDGKVAATGTAADGVLEFPAEVAQTLPTGKNVVMLKDSANALVGAEITVWSALISTATELENWTKYTEITDIVSATDAGKAYGYYTYTGMIGLAADIDMTGKTISSDCWSMEATKGFQGIFDGRGYTISNATYGKGGLFGTFGVNAVLKNVAFVGGQINAYAWATVGSNDPTAFFSDCVVAHNVAGTIENCVFDVATVGTESNSGHGGYVLGAVVSANVSNTVVYTVNWQQPAKGWALAHSFLAFGFEGTFSNSYAFVKAEGSPSTATTDAKAQAANANSAWGTSKEFSTFGGLTTYGYERKLSEAVSDTDSTTIGAEMATKLTGEYWVLTGDKVALQNPAELAE